MLLLDEWLAGLNRTELEQGIELIHSLRSDGLTIILVEHVMDAIRSLCDRCIVMNAGRKIAEGPPPPCWPTPKSSAPTSVRPMLENRNCPEGPPSIGLRPSHHAIYRSL